jgi:polar amino acid transport system substrate-binding protein
MNISKSEVKVKKIIFSILIITFLTSAIGCVKTNNSSDNSKKELVVGMELAYPPFEMTDNKGNPAGISVDLAKAIGEYLGRPVKIENMAFSGLIPALTTKKIDIILSSMTITDKRKEVVSFSDPYAKTYLALLINKNSKVNSAADLDKDGVVIAVKKGTTGHIYASDHFKNAKINVYDNVSACVLDVSQGKADAFIYDQLTIYENWKKYESTTKVSLEPFQTDFEYWGIALRKDDTKLQEDINKFLKDYKEKKGFESLAGKYLKEMKETFDKMNIPFFF